MDLLLPEVTNLIESKKLEQMEVAVKGLQCIREFSIEVLDKHLKLITTLLLRICSSSFGSL